MPSFYMTSSINLVDATPEVRKEAASVLQLPGVGDRQHDLAYFTAEFVASGTNLNKAHFLPSELLSAAGSVTSKALDIEHNELEIIGHIYNSVLLDGNRNPISVSKSIASETSIDMTKATIDIAAVVYKDRFPEIASEILNNEWAVSMECYYADFDLLIGNSIIPKSYAELIGYDVASIDNIIGKNGSVILDGKEVASGEIARVLRNISFSGCGITKNPANVGSIMFEAASGNDTVVFELPSEKSTNNVTSYSIGSNGNNLSDNSDITNLIKGLDKYIALERFIDRFRK